MPAMTPTLMPMSTEMPIQSGAIAAGSGEIACTTWASTMPMPMPMHAPSSDSVADSTSTWMWMSRRFARVADAVLARPVGHRQEHDVHDDDAADDERDRDESRERDHEDAADVLPEAHGLVGRLDREVVRLGRPQLVAHAHDRLDIH